MTTDQFIAKHGSQKGDRLQGVWNNSFPNGTEYDKLFGRHQTKEQNFTNQVKRYGFTETEINDFLSINDSVMIPD
jgi:hypothetical protein